MIRNSSTFGFESGFVGTKAEVGAVIKHIITREEVCVH